MFRNGLLRVFAPGVVMFFDNFKKNCFSGLRGLYTAKDFFEQVSNVIMST